MRRERVLLGVAVVLAVAVLATAAAGLDGRGGGASEVQSSEGVGIGSNTGSGIGNGTGVGIQFADGDVAATGIVPPGAIELAIRLVFAGSILLTVLYVIGVVLTEGVRELLAQLRAALIDGLRTVAVFLLLLLFVLALSALAGDGGGGLAGSGSVGAALFGGDGGGSPAALPELPVPLIVAAGLLVVAGLAVASDRLDDAGGGGVAAVAATTDDDGTAPTVAAGGRGGGLAGRYEDVAAENDVYRAWRALTESLEGVDRRTATPAEVARRARRAGHDEAAVAELTDLFRTVRYHGRAATPERERRAETAVERIDAERTADSEGADTDGWERETGAAGRDAEDET